MTKHPRELREMIDRIRGELLHIPTNEERTMHISSSEVRVLIAELEHALNEVQRYKDEQGFVHSDVIDWFSDKNRWLEWEVTRLRNALAAVAPPKNG